MVAEMLAATIDEAKDKVPYTEFISWVEYFRRKIKRRTKDEFYLANLRWEIYQLRKAFSSVFGGKLADREPKDFLMTHADTGEDRHTRLSRVGGRPGTFAVGDPGYAAASKAAWFARLGLTPPPPKGG